MAMAVIAVVVPRSVAPATRAWSASTSVLIPSVSTVIAPLNSSLRPRVSESSAATVIPILPPMKFSFFKPNVVSELMAFAILK